MGYKRISPQKHSTQQQIVMQRMVQMEAEHNNRKIIVRQVNGEAEWNKIRSIFVDSFFQYPLYQHIAQNVTTRAEFLKRYFDANYEVAVRRGSGSLHSIEIQLEDVNKVELIGGFILVPPVSSPSSGGGWSIQDDSLYWDAYKRYKMDVLDGDAYNRLIKYESWENTNICKRLANTGKPMWNGLFLALKHKYRRQGYGDAFMLKCQDYLRKLDTVHMQMKRDSTRCEIVKQSLKLSTLLNYLSLLSHRSVPQDIYIEGANKQCTAKQSDHSIIIWITHDHRISKFYLKTGANLIHQNRYSHSLSVNVLGMDIFNDGDVAKTRNNLLPNQKQFDVNNNFDKIKQN